MGLGLGKLVRETSGPPLVCLLEDSTRGATEIVFRDPFGAAIMVVESDGTLLIRDSIHSNQEDYWGVQDE